MKKYIKESYFFKTKEDVVRYGISPNLIKEDDPQCIPISEEEYNEAIAELEAKAQEEFEAEQKAEQSYIEQLESENAALLFQILTGEELSDV